jgi:hypothetical protein
MMAGLMKDRCSNRRRMNNDMIDEESNERKKGIFNEKKEKVFSRYMERCYYKKITHFFSLF